MLTDAQLGCEHWNGLLDLAKTLKVISSNWTLGILVNPPCSSTINSQCACKRWRLKRLLWDWTLIRAHRFLFPHCWAKQIGGRHRASEESLVVCRSVRCNVLPNDPHLVNTSTVHSVFFFFFYLDWTSFIYWSSLLFHVIFIYWENEKRKNLKGEKESIVKNKLNLTNGLFIPGEQH